jgi:predicted aspartyl protease
MVVRRLSRRLRLFFHGIAIVVAGAIAGCSVHSQPISRFSEQRLKDREVAGDKIGLRVFNGGSRYELEMFRARLPVEPVEIPMERSIARLPAATVMLNGAKPLRMIMDTGAQLSVVDASSAIAAKADVFAPEGGMLRVAGVGGEERAWLARFDRARFGPIELNGLVTIVRRETSNVHFGGVPFGTLGVNLVGAPVLGAFSFVTFDFPRERLVFSGETRFVPSRGAVRIPMTVRDSLPYVPLGVGGRTIQAMVDTGARDELFLNEEIVRKWKLDSLADAGGTFKAAGLGGMIRGRRFRLPAVRLGQFTVENVFVDTSSGPWQARIGSELLERWRSTFDFRGGALWLESPTR